MISTWLHELALASLFTGGVCAAVVAFDVARRPQRMWIMNVVWAATALFGTVAVLGLYFSQGRNTASRRAQLAQKQSKKRTPFGIMVTKGSLHCGAGCTLGDICAETLAFAFPSVAVASGWHWLFNERIFAVWLLDFAFAYAFGIVFQYFTIAPMRGLSVGEGLIAAAKADTISITAWQIGMYGFMALAHFYIFPHLLQANLRPESAEFWFMMQIAMLLGFATSYPANWWLLRIRAKEKM
jgi:hypothetical protein